MPSTGWESEDLLRRWNQKAGRPASDAITDESKYGWLADGQASVITKIAGIVPRVLYGAPTAMETADGGYTWTFGEDGNGYALFPMGKARIFMDLVSVPFAPLRPGIDYLDEGTTIRMPNNMPWSGTLYWYGIDPPEQLSETVQPVLFPPSARILIVIEAVRQFAQQFGRNNALEQAMDREWDNEFPPTMTMLRTHFRGGGALGSMLRPLLPAGAAPFGLGV